MHARYGAGTTMHPATLRRARGALMRSTRFSAAAAALTEAADESSFAMILQRFLPVDGVAVSTLGDLLGSETVSSSDAVAARLDEVQFDLGEGPCWDALSTREPVIEPDFENRQNPLWPGFSNEIRQHTIGAIFAFPLIIGPLRLGAIDLYTTAPTHLTALDIAQTSMLARLLGRLILQRALRLSSDYFADQGVKDGSEYSRRLVHQATGMVISQLGVVPDDALLVIQGHAFATGRRMMDVAGEIVEGRLRFTAGTNGIEEQK